jgi:GTP-binding protein
MTKRKENFRNIAIIAHVDHGKTTLLDGMLRQSGEFRENQQLVDRVMDSMDLERERGITITAKNTSVRFQDVKINIVDTPGHSDFGGEVERSLNLADGALLLVDASEGPLPQTRFVLKKTLEKKLPVVLVINKIDRSDARVDEVLNEVYDLFLDLDADEEQIEFPIIYTIAKQGIAKRNLTDPSESLLPLFETILKTIPAPVADDNAPPQFLVTNLDYDPYVGQIAVGRLYNGVLEMNKTYALCGKEGVTTGIKFSACYHFEGLHRLQTDRVECGDIIAVAGVKNIAIGDTITSEDDPRPLPRIQIDEPTISMIFYVNNSPFTGRYGKFLTTRHLQERLIKEVMGNVSLQVKATQRKDAFEVCGRGELQMAVLIETLRREGYELMVSKPRVITREENGQILEPVERVFIDVPEEKVGVVTEKLSERKGRMMHLENLGHGRVDMEFVIPSRGLIGFRSQFMTDTNGAGIMNTLFEGYAPWFGSIPHRTNGAILADRPGRVTAYACQGMADRGELFVEPGMEVYAGMIIGERNRSEDLPVNITREKKLTNMRASGSDNTIPLRPARKMNIDRCLEFIAGDELIEVTPQTVILRKMELDPVKRAKTRGTGTS